MAADRAMAAGGPVAMAGPVNAVAVAGGGQVVVQQVVVAGGPWHTRVTTRFLVRAPRPDGSLYTNEGVQLLRLRWGRIVEDRLYEDTQLLAEELATRGVAA